MSNRALIIRALCEAEFELTGLAEAGDTRSMVELLAERPDIYDAGPAGTTFRFLTAFLALQPGRQILTGSKRMKQRPVGPLVDALRELGVPVEYLEKEGYPPLGISTLGKDGQQTDLLRMPASTSSQFISALLLIAPALPRGLTIELVGEVVSRPYISMTLRMMAHFGAEYEWSGSRISVAARPYRPRPFAVEADWSAASYYYALAALSREAELTVAGLHEHSLQGDAVVSEIMEQFGVHTRFVDGGVRLLREPQHRPQERFRYNFLECPDLAQTVAVLCAGLGVPAELSGLKTLRIKETDRIGALIEELGKVGVKAWAEGDDRLILTGKANIPPGLLIDTYEDHRMAMAFAPLATLGQVCIEAPKVVGKSYPSFWEHLSGLGLEIREIAG